MIDTKKVADRRELRFETLAEAVADAESLVAAEAEGRLRAAGNWTLGQALSHLASWAEYPFEGYPEGANPPWFMRVILKLAKGRLLGKGMPAGVKIPKVEGGTYGMDDAPPAEALERLRAAFDRLQAECPDCPNPLFGPLSHEDWRRLNMRHSELHLSFYRSEP